MPEVLLSGQSLGSAENMFRQYRWEISGLLHAGENELTIRFASPVKFVLEHYQQRNLPGVSDVHIPGGPYLRKAPCHFGWDWGPKLPPTGIWREIRLEAGGRARLGGGHLRQRHP